MKLKYINQIRANLSITANKKTSNILDGTYKSVYRGKSMNFENLREYVIQDDVKDIDWKASSRSGSLLVKQFIAEKKHNILLVMDSNKSMDGDSLLGDSKKEVALYSAGTLGYIAIKNGDYVGMVIAQENGSNYKPFKYDLYSLERYLTEYESTPLTAINSPLEASLNYICRNIKRKMIIFIITDLKGLNSMSNKILKETSSLHDVFAISISDASITGDNSFDLDNNHYIPQIFREDKTMANIEANVKKEVLEKNEKRMKKYKIDMVSIDDKNQIPLKIVELLERHSYAGNR